LRPEKADAMRTRLTALAGLLLALWLAQPAAPAAAKDPVYSSTFSSLAVSGYDPVAYFAEGRPVEGRSDHELEWNGATWRFSSAGNLAAFRADPAAFAPQYGGYCAWAVSQGYTASTDPQAWRIVDGKLYLNYSLGVQRRWQEDIPGNIVKGDANWPRVLE
jgi:YHS domain-containing protein